jgi:hypothetical protein
VQHVSDHIYFRVMCCSAAPAMMNGPRGDVSQNTKSPGESQCREALQPTS